MNWLSDAPVVVKNVAAVPSGPTKLKAPPELLLPAAWNLSVVFAGTVAVHDKVVHVAAKPVAGLASFTEETRLAEAAKPTDMYVLNA